MAQRKTSADETKARDTKGERLTAGERAMMRARAKKLKLAKDGDRAVRQALAALSGDDRGLGEAVHEIITAAAPELTPKTWYGMPAYANKDGKVVCFFRNATKFKERYATLGFNDSARLDDGSLWPVAFALMNLTETEKRTICALVKRAVR